MRARTLTMLLGFTVAACDAGGEIGASGDSVCAEAMTLLASCGAKNLPELGECTPPRQQVASKILEDGCGTSGRSVTSFWSDLFGGADDSADEGGAGCSMWDLFLGGCPGQEDAEALGQEEGTIHRNNGQTCYNDDQCKSYNCQYMVCRPMWIPEPEEDEDELW